jgi:hypothetical protein
MVSATATAANGTTAGAAGATAGGEGLGGTYYPYGSELSRLATTAPASPAPANWYYCSDPAATPLRSPVPGW